ncbi:MAG: DNA polymerase III subunit delta' [Actinomycetota bacterium]|nr:DNA polymerase III subunit delta' [Actinomycetota bacterium]
MSVWATLGDSPGIEALQREVEIEGAGRSWLLAGPRGSGKRRAALAMAAALNCSQAPGRGCGECRSCARTLRLRHPDVHYVSPEGPIISVDVIREAIVPEAARSPFEASVKVFVIEEADRMNDSAQNALLKTLEEPRADTAFVLISDHEDELLETIRSRCLVVHLHPMPEERLVQSLVARGASAERAALAARASDGDPERAEALAFDEHVLERRRFWTSIPSRLRTSIEALDAAAEIVEEARAAVKERERAHKEEVVELAEALGEGRRTAAARQALAKRHRRELRRVEEEVLAEAMDFLASFYRDVVVTRTGAVDRVYNLDLQEELRAWADSELRDGGLLAGAERCIAARESLTRNANVPLAMEAALLDLVKLIGLERVAPAGTTSH